MRLQKKSLFTLSQSSFPDPSEYNSSNRTSLLPNTFTMWHIIVSISLIHSLAVATLNTTSLVYDFSELTPSPTMNWTPCFGPNLTCALLEVPLDYGDPSAGTTAIAFTKWTAPVQPADDLLVNYGGPGASAVGMFVSLESEYLEFYGTSHNIVAFDPRGVNNSGPTIDCFPGDPETRNNFNSWYYRFVSSAASDSVTSIYNAADAWGQWCTPVLGGTNGSAQYVSTPAVARDMLSFAQAEAALLGKSAEEAKVSYYGFSYGTALGATFASMFPQNIGKLILDGVIDSEDYYRGEWKADLFHTDQAIETFFISCFNAGNTSCPIWEPSPDKIASRFQSILDNLKANPIPITNPQIQAMPLLATYSDLKKTLLNAVYFPLSDFPRLAQILVDLENGNGSSLIESAGLQFGCNPLYQNTGYDPNTLDMVVSCTDGNYHGNHGNVTTSLKHLQQYFDYLQNQSKWLGDAWGVNAYTCKSFDILPPPSGQFNGERPFPRFFAHLIVC
jgi:pimeloyl-ACP methyl ester carboxylesterase